MRKLHSKRQSLLQEMMGEKLRVRCGYGWSKYRLSRGGVVLGLSWDLLMGEDSGVGSGIIWRIYRKLGYQLDFCSIRDYL